MGRLAKDIIGTSDNLSNTVPDNADSKEQIFISPSAVDKMPRGITLASSLD